MANVCANTHLVTTHTSMCTQASVIRWCICKCIIPTGLLGPPPTYPFEAIYTCITTELHGNHHRKGGRAAELCLYSPVLNSDISSQTFSVSSTHPIYSMYCAEFSHALCWVTSHTICWHAVTALAAVSMGGILYYRAVPTRLPGSLEGSTHCFCA
jgi:hypothetical protein